MGKTHLVQEHEFGVPKLSGDNVQALGAAHKKKVWGENPAQRNAINLETCWIVNRKERMECLECARVAFCGCGAQEARRRECKETWREVARWRLKGAPPQTQRWNGAWWGGEGEGETKQTTTKKGFPKHTQQMHRGMWSETRPPQTTATWKNVTITVIAFHKEAKEGAGGGGLFSG